MTDWVPAKFLAALRKLDRGQLATLRRAAGEPLGADSRAMALFYRILPVQMKPSEEQIFFTVATLYPLNAIAESPGGFGRTMRVVRVRSSTDGIDRRMAALLEADYDFRSLDTHGLGELGYRLGQAVRLAKSQGVGVDWVQLTHDLLRWQSVKRFVQKQWARDYFGTERPADGAEEEKQGGN